MQLRATTINTRNDIDDMLVITGEKKITERTDWESVMENEIHNMKIETECSD